VRSIPEIDSRYPLWEQPDFVRDVDEGRFYLPDAEELKRETIVTSPVDAEPQYCMRMPGPSFIPAIAAVTTGGFFIFGTYHLWWLAMASLALAVCVFVYWLWTGTAHIPEKPAKDVGLGRRLPLYASGTTAVGWWGMFITMLADQTAFVCLVFGYFFFWTLHADFPPDPAAGPGVFWPALAGGLVLSAWVLVIVARSLNRRNASTGFYAAGLMAMLAAVGSGAAMLAGPWLTGLDPEQHVYPATVWVLAAWSAVHVVLGVIMLLYCLARRLAGRMTDEYDVDMSTVTLYWHFCALTVAVTVLVIAGFPRVA
jgi:cytochrome c oxidase subunit I+III